MGNSRRAFALLVATTAGCESCTSDGGAVPIVVPSTLSAHATSLELSGIAWAPALNRYLAVSDDIAGAAGKHAPLLFTIDRQGLMDPSPMVIEGISELNDPESICAGPNNTFFVTTSHAMNRHGRRPLSRRMLIHVAVAERSFRVLGQVDLSDVHAADREVAHVLSHGALDIEALAFREEGLLIGLKAPLADDGSATILELHAPERALSTGTVPPDALRMWSRPRLCLPKGGEKTVCEGISDMTFLPDGQLLLVANTPKGMPNDGGGSLWRVPNAAPPVLVRQFVGLKPEGITLSRSGSSLVIVFDTDGTEPRWLTLALPR